MSGSNRIVGIVLAVVVVAAAAAGGFYVLNKAPQSPAPAPAPAASAPAPAEPAPAPAATAECYVPGPVPAMPRGDIATPEDMKIQHDAVQGFVKALEAYQTCLNQKAASAPAGTDEQVKLRWIAEGNRAVDDAHALANAFAAQLKIYHQRHPEPLPEK